MFYVGKAEAAYFLGTITGIAVALPPFTPFWIFGDFVLVVLGGVVVMAAGR